MIQSYFLKLCVFEEKAMILKIGLPT